MKIYKYKCSACGLIFKRTKEDVGFRFFKLFYKSQCDNSKYKIVWCRRVFK